MSVRGLQSHREKWCLYSSWSAVCIMNCASKLLISDAYFISWVQQDGCLQYCHQFKTRNYTDFISVLPSDCCTCFSTGFPTGQSKLPEVEQTFCHWDWIKSAFLCFCMCCFLIRIYLGSHNFFLFTFSVIQRNTVAGYLLNGCCTLWLWLVRSLCKN